MSKKFSKEPLRGMKDFYPSALRVSNWIIETIKDVVERYGYEEFKTPQLEPIEIFAAKFYEIFEDLREYFINIPVINL